MGVPDVKSTETIETYSAEIAQSSAEFGFTYRAIPKCFIPFPVSTGRLSYVTDMENDGD